MLGIGLGKAIDTYGIAIVVAIILPLLVRLVWYLVKNMVNQQKEERTYYRNLVTNDMKEIHKDNLKNAEYSLKNAKLNKQSIVNQRKIIGLIELIDRRNNVKK